MSHVEPASQAEETSAQHAQPQGEDAPEARDGYGWGV